MRFCYRELCRQLDEYETIIIYGTGSYARIIYPELVKRGLKYKIAFFAQTEKAEFDFIDGIQVVSIDLLECNKEKCVIFIAVGVQYSEKIQGVLSEYGYKNIVACTEYEADKCLQRLSGFNEYCDYVADWYVETYGGSSDKEEIVKELLKKGSRADKTALDLIVIICGSISVRTIKIAGALRRKGYHIIILNYCKVIYDWCLEEMRKLNIQIYNCDCIEEMLYRALHYSPLIYFFEPQWGNCLWAEIMLKHKQNFGKIVIAQYDVLNDGYVGMPAENLATEKYALEHADGIVWRWFSKERLERKGFLFRGKSLQFLDYCSHNEREIKENLNDLDTRIVKLCAVGGTGDYYVEKNYETPYVDWARVGEILDVIGNKDDVIFHFYFGVFYKEENLEQCKVYEKQYKNFKFFLNVEHGDLLKKLKYYDYGCEFCVKGEWPSEDTIIDNYYGSNLMNSTRNVFFDFLSAGIPIIATTPIKCLEYLQQYGIIVKMDLFDINIEYLQQKKKYYRQKVKEARNELDIDSQIPRLIQFFKEV